MITKKINKKAAKKLKSGSGVKTRLTKSTKNVSEKIKSATKNGNIIKKPNHKNVKRKSKSNWVENKKGSSMEIKLKDISHVPDDLSSANPDATPLDASCDVVHKDIKKEKEKNLGNSEPLTTANVVKNNRKRKTSDTFKNNEDVEMVSKDISLEVNAPLNKIKNNKLKQEKEPVTANQNTEEDIDEIKTEQNIISPTESTAEKESLEKDENKSEDDFHYEFVENTIFVGNVPLNCTEKALNIHFKKYGPIKSMRFRCIPVKDLRVSKRVAHIKKEFHPDRTSQNAYIRFVNKEDSIKAVAENGRVFQNHHLRVDLCGEKEKRDEKCALFIGNLDFKAEDEDLWTLFESCGEISSVRINRNKNGMSLGTAYINFKKSDSVELALEMGEVSLKNRILRIQASKGKRKSDRKKDKAPWATTPRNKAPFKKGSKKPQFNNKYSNPRKTNFKPRSSNFKKSKISRKNGPLN